MRYKVLLLALLLAGCHEDEPYDARKTMECIRGHDQKGDIAPYNYTFVCDEYAPRTVPPQRPNRSGL